MENDQTDYDFLKEPGYYKDNEFGIRIEDVAVIVPVHTKVGMKWLTQTDLLIVYKHVNDFLLHDYKNCQGNFFVNVFFFPSAW